MGASRRPLFWGRDIALRVPLPPSKPGLRLIPLPAPPQVVRQDHYLSISSPFFALVAGMHQRFPGGHLKGPCGGPVRALQDFWVDIGGAVNILTVTR